MSAGNANRVDSEHLTGKVRIAIVLGGDCQVAWWCCMCLLFVSMTGARRMHFDFLTFETETALTSGTITDVTQEAMHRPGQADLISYDYAFQYDLDGHPLLGRAHSETVFQKGSVVDVEYVTAEPRKARIVGTTTRRRSGMILVIGAALFFACIAWTLWRINGLPNRSHTIRAHLAASTSRATWGLLPKLRVDRDGQITTRGTAWLLLAPIVSIGLLVLVMLLVEM